jgi:N-methylhydantoinase A
VLRAAAGIVEVANAEMLGALRTLTVARGIDPRRYALIPFGGAGPLHATAIAEALGVERILCPRASGVLSAFGLAAAAPRRDATGSFEAAKVETLLERATAALGAEPARRRTRFAFRYVGQSFELWIEAPAGAGEEELRERFEAVHEREFGYREPGGAVELVTVTASVWGAAPALRTRAGDAVARRGTQRIVHAGREIDATLLIGAPAPGDRVDGPAICALPEATLLITPGWRAHVLGDGTIELTRP